MNTQSTFSPKLLIGFVGLAIVTFVVSLYLSSFERFSVNTLGPSTYSRSAIGHDGIAEVLSSLEIPVTRSQNNSQKKIKDGLLVLAEPNLSLKWEENFKALLSAAPKALVVLPKWTGEPNSAHSDWIDRAALYSSVVPQSVMKAALWDSEVVRVDKVEAWTKNDFTRAPIIDERVQLIKAKNLTPLIASDKGILLGELRIGKRVVWVLSDPDVIANHGLGADGKRNAVLAVELFNKLRGSGPVVFDESIHGFVSLTAAPWRLLFKFPYAIVSILLSAAIALLLWATMGRFGPADRDKPALAAGKHGLIENVSKLMGFAGYQKLMVRRYVDAAIKDVGRQLHAPKKLSQQELIAWLAQIGKARKVSLDIEELLARTDNLIREHRQDLSSSGGVTKDIYRWKGEMLNGPSGYSRDH